MVTNDQVKSDKNDWRISLVKLTGKKIADIEGYVSTETGEPVFKLSELIFEDETAMGIEGEHDFPYLCQYPKEPQPNMDNETLLSLD